jgi:8-oxo-dGTP pyrophosphatase MutT (NUDIX family)
VSGALAGTVRREVWFHDPAAPTPSRVVPAAFTAVRGPDGTLLLVQRCDSGVWELPGGCVEVGESAPDAAVRETAEEAGVRVRITGLVGVYSDPGHVVRGVDGHVRQQFAVVLSAEPVAPGPVPPQPRPDGVETRAAAWVSPADLVGLPMEPPTRLRIAHALAPRAVPHPG